MGALSRLAAPPARGISESRSFSLDDYVAAVLSGIGTFGLRQTLQGKDEHEIDSTLASFVDWALKRDGIVFAAIALRAALFSEARFAFRRKTNGQFGDLFTNDTLAPLERPSIGETTGDLLTRMSVHEDLAGESFVLRTGDEVTAQIPDWISVAVGSKSMPDNPLWAYDCRVIGYGYHPGGYDLNPVPFQTWPAGPVGDPDNRIAHFRTFPDPATRFRGLTWLQPVMTEIQADRGMTEHKLAFLRNGATPNSVVTLDSPLITDEKSFQAWIDIFEQQHKGAANQYKNLYVLGNTSLKVVGTTLSQMDFRNVQGAGELQIATAARVPPLLLGLKDGFAGSSLSTGAAAAARRFFADFTMRPRWRNVAGSLESIIPPPGQSASLWYDDAGIPALAEDEKDKAQIQQLQANTMAVLAREGWDPDEVVAGVMAGNLRRLVGNHSGMASVQLHPRTGTPADVKVTTPDPKQLPPGDLPAKPRQIPPESSAQRSLEADLIRLLERATPQKEDRSEGPQTINLVYDADHNLTSISIR